MIDAEAELETIHRQRALWGLRNSRIIEDNVQWLAEL